MDNLSLAMHQLMGKINECNTMCREMGTDWEVVLRRKETAFRVIVKLNVREKIKTIKAIRTAMGWGLRESKEAVDTAEANGEYELFRSNNVETCNDLWDKLRSDDASIMDNFLVVAP